MKKYYTEYPKTEFVAKDDSEALSKTKAMFVYCESDTKDGTPFVILRDENGRSK